VGECAMLSSMVSTPHRRPGRPAVPITRERLLSVAARAFAELGYDGAAMGDIAERAGLRKSSLFHHFPTKDGLYGEVLVAVLGALHARMIAAHDEPGTFLERMQRSTLAVQRYLGENPVAARLLVREFVQGGNRVLPEGGDVLDGLFRGLFDRLEGAMAEGIIATQDVRQLAMSLAGVHLLYYAVPDLSSRLVGEDVFDAQRIEERARVVTEQVMRIVGAVGANPAGATKR
jgi:AcrR family transcriptional regulator